MLLKTKLASNLWAFASFWQLSWYLRKIVLVFHFCNEAARKAVGDTKVSKAEVSKPPH